MILFATTRCIDSFRDCRVIPSDMSFASAVVRQFYKQQNKSVQTTDDVFQPKSLLYALIRRSRRSGKTEGGAGGVVIFGKAHPKGDKQRTHICRLTRWCWGRGKPNGREGGDTATCGNLTSPIMTRRVYQIFFSNNESVQA